MECPGVFRLSICWEYWFQQEKCISDTDLYMRLYTLMLFFFLKKQQHFFKGIINPHENACLNKLCEKLKTQSHATSCKVCEKHNTMQCQHSCTHWPRCCRCEKHNIMQCQHSCIH